MPTGSEERTNARKEEIINACEQLYQTQSFREITIKEIGQITSCSRTSIYNYFETKEEIFLALLKREYDTWVDELNQITESHDALNNQEIADAIAHSLDQRHQLLKILSMNHYDLEDNSRLELLTDFKVSYGNALHAVMAMLGIISPGYGPFQTTGVCLCLFPVHVWNLSLHGRNRKAKESHAGCGCGLYLPLPLRSDESRTPAAIVLTVFYQTLVRYCNFQDQGMILGYGCGSPSMTRHMFHI